MSVPSLTSEDPYDVNNRSVYRLPFARMVGMYLVLALGLFWIIFFIWSPLSAENPHISEDYPWVVLAGFLLFDLCAYISLASLRAKLITSPWGIEYYDLGIKLRAPWKNVLGFEELRYVYRWVDSLMTSQPAEMSRFMLASLIMSKYRYLQSSDMDIDKICHSIPIGKFVDDCRYSSLGKEIRRYAPHLLSKKEEQQEDSSETGTAGTRDLETASNQAAVEVGHSTRDVAVAAFPTTHREGKTRRGLWRKVIALAVVVVEVLLAFSVAPSIYRWAQPLLGAVDPLPGQLFLKGPYGYGDLSRNGQFLAVGDQVLTFPEGTSKFKVTLPPGKDGTSPPIGRIVLSADGKLVAASDEYGNALIWQVADGHLRQTLSVTQPIMVRDSVAGRTTVGYIYIGAFSPDGKKLAAIGPTGQIIVWNVDAGTLLSTMKSSQKIGSQGASVKLLFAPRSQLLVSLIEGTLEIWLTQDGSLEGKIDPGDRVMDMDMSADGKTLALGTLHGGIYLWDVRGGSVSKTIKEPKKTGPSPGAIYGIAISPDGKTIMSGSSQGGIQIWSADGVNLKNMRDSSGTTVRWMVFSPDGSKLIYSKYDDHTIWVWANGLGAT
jgi:WD40 repeat protein